MCLISVRIVFACETIRHLFPDLNDDTMCELKKGRILLAVSFRDSALEASRCSFVKSLYLRVHRWLVFKIQPCETAVSQILLQQEHASCLYQPNTRIQRPALQQVKSTIQLPVPEYWYQVHQNMNALTFYHYRASKDDRLPFSVDVYRNFSSFPLLILGLYPIPHTQYLYCIPAVHHNASHSISMFW